MEENKTMVLATDEEKEQAENSTEVQNPTKTTPIEEPLNTNELIKIKKFVIDYPVTTENPNQEAHRQNAIIYIDIDQVKDLPDALCWVDLVKTE